MHLSFEKPSNAVNVSSSNRELFDAEMRKKKTLFNIVQNMNYNSFILTPTGDLTVLRNILLYHFSNGTFINGGLEGGVTNLLKTFQGKNLQVKSVCHLLEGFFFF